MATVIEVNATLRAPHAFQQAFIASKAKRRIVRAGRRSGKTVGLSIAALEWFLAGQRVLYATPTSEQHNAFWFEVNRALGPAIAAGAFHKNESEHFIERVGTENRIKAKTAWDPDTLRGDYADRLLLDEYQLMNERTWAEVGAPMLLDNNGDAIFAYTPPSLRSTGISRASDPRHAAKLFGAAREDKTGRWEAFHFTSMDNPHISKLALADITQDMSQGAYRQEILGEDDELQAGMLVYSAFNERTCKIGRFPIPETWPRYVGHDFGTANPAALFFAQDPETAYLYVYQEYLPGPGRSVAQHVAQFKEMTLGATVIKRVGGSHQEDEIRQGYTAHGWPIQEPEANAVAVQIDRVRRRMEQNKLFVFNDLYNYLGELATCVWEIDAQGQRTGKIQDEKRYHLGAAARYLLSDFRPDIVPGVRREPVRLRSW